MLALSKFLKKGRCSRVQVVFRHEAPDPKCPKLRRPCISKKDAKAVGEPKSDSLTVLGRPLGYFIFSLTRLNRTVFTNIFRRL